MGKIDRELGVLGFAASAVLPGEDPAQFNQLLQELRAQYQPEGIAEEGAVRSMTEAMFRRQHLEIFQRAHEARIRWGHHFHFPNDPAGLPRIVAETFQARLAYEERVAQPTGPAGAAAMPSTGGSNGPTEEHTVSEAQSWGPFAHAAALIKTSTAVKDLCHTLEEGQPPPAPASVELGNYVGTQIMLAALGDLITPESYLAELRMKKELDEAFDRSLARLMKMQKARKGTAAPTKTTPPTKPTMMSSSLSPDWTKRRR